MSGHNEFIENITEGVIPGAGSVGPKKRAARRLIASHSAAGVVSAFSFDGGSSAWAHMSNGAQSEGLAE